VYDSDLSDCSFFNSTNLAAKRIPVNLLKTRVLLWHALIAWILRFFKKKSNPMQSRSTTTVLIAIIIVVTFPIWIGLVGGAIGIVAGVFGAMIGVFAGMFGAIFGLIGGFFGWLFDWHWGGPHFFHFPFFAGKMLIFIAIVVLLVMATKPKKA
jgi:hypothetical protein